jgi:hypothetical protein
MIQNSSDSVSRQPSNTERYSSGIGYVVLPNESDIKRQDYIYNCLKNCNLTIFIEGEGNRNNVPASQQIFNDIIFPDKFGQLGSRVVWINDPLLGQIYVVAIIGSSAGYKRQEEDSFRLVRQLGDSFVEITGNSKTGSISVGAYAKKPTNITISATDKTGNSNINFRVTGNHTTKASKNIEEISNVKNIRKVEDEKILDDFSYEEITTKKIESQTFRHFINALEKFKLSVGEDFTKISSIEVDEDFVRIIATQFLNLSGSENVKIKTKKLQLNGGEEAMVLGNILKEMLDDLIQEISKIQVVTPMGLMPIYNKAQVVSFMLKTKKILSRYGFLN